MKKILVTGGLGYIGSHTVVELQQSGFEVIIIDDFCNSEIATLDRIEKITGIRPAFEEIDLKNRADVQNFFNRHSVDGCIHFAALKKVGESQQLPLEYYDNNLNGLLNLLFEFREHQLDYFIFSSSCTVYGQADHMPIAENAPIKPAESAYGSTKQMCETILKDFTNVYQKNTILLRYFNPIGAHPSALIGELPLGVPNNLIPYITQAAAGIRKELLVFGHDYDTPDGTCIRDYIDVMDLAKAHVKALSRLLENKNTESLEVYNLGTGTGSSVLDIIKTFEDVNQVKVNYRFAPRRDGDITKAYADATLAREKLGWTAETPLAETLRTAWEWQKTLY